MKQETRLKRLRKLLEVLEQVRDEKRPLDLDVFIDDRIWSHKTPLLNTTPAEECGTSSCILGWAGRAKWFRKRGLKTSLSFGTVFYKEEEGFQAGAEFFGMSYSEAETIFRGVGRSRRPQTDMKEAFRRVEKFIKKVEAGRNDLAPRNPIIT
jgi:hypothetical protein